MTSFSSSSPPSILNLTHSLKLFSTLVPSIINFFPLLRFREAMTAFSSGGLREEVSPMSLTRSIGTDVRDQIRILRS